MQNIQAQLRERFYAHVPFPLSDTVIEKAVEAFFEFLKQPDDVRNHIDFSVAKRHRRGDVGFKHRDAEDRLYSDSKDFFHFHPAIFERYSTFLEKNPVVADFSRQAMVIWELVYKTLQDILNTFEKDFPGVYGKIFDAEPEHIHILLRFLKYEWTESGQYLAKPHYDAGSFTLAVSESCPGLRIGSGPDDLKNVERREGEAIFMLSSNFKKIIETDQLHAGWHDVIQLDKRAVGKPFSRWAVVAFIEGHDVEALSRTETHKWYGGESVKV